MNVRQTHCGGDDDGDLMMMRVDHASLFALGPSPRKNSALFSTMMMTRTAPLADVQMRSTLVSHSHTSSAPARLDPSSAYP